MSEYKEWVRKATKNKRGELRKSLITWKTPPQVLKDLNLRDRDMVHVEFLIGENRFPTIDSVLVSGGEFRLTKEFAENLERIWYEDKSRPAHVRLSRPESKPHLYEAEIRRALTLSSQERLKRLPADDQPPLVSSSTAQVFIRNSYVGAEALIKANGKCEVCQSDAPFISNLTGMPYLEVHHIIWLSRGGADSMCNVIALCPNCHREAHFGDEALWKAKLLKINRIGRNARLP